MQNIVVQTSTTNDLTDATAETKISTPSSSESILIAAPALATSRYNRQLLIPSISLHGQKQLQKAKVLVIGLGGLGSPACLYLAGAGVHTLGLLDADSVELSNLHRQVVHREDSVKSNMSKVASAIRGCTELNSQVNYISYETRLTVENALGIVEQYDIVLDCTDNPATRYLISDVCVLLGKILVSGAAQRLEGQLMVLNQPSGDESERGPCYRCIFPRPPSPETVRGCNEIGILGPVVGTIGVLMASEAIRLIVQGQKSGWRKPTMLLYNAWAPDPKNMFRTIGLRGRRRDCVACGDEDILMDKKLEGITRESLTEGRMDYEAFCGMVDDIKLLKEENRIVVRDFVKRMQDPADEHIVVDVREETEFELGSKIRGSINIPISKVLRDAPQALGQLDKNSALDGSQKAAKSSRSVYFICQRGNDSQIVAQKLIDLDLAGGHPMRWVGDLKGGFVEMEKV